MNVALLHPAGARRLEAFVYLEGDAYPAHSSMKQVFISAFLILSVCSVLTAMWRPESQSAKPVLYWVTNPQETRNRQARAFADWLERTHQRQVDFRIDADNHDLRKKIIQGVAGVAGDLIDFRSGDHMRFAHAVGMVADVTEIAGAKGFPAHLTYDAAVPEFVFEGRQYGFPAGSFIHMYWVNEATFEQYDLPLPQERMSLGEFEALGREFVARANPEGERRQNFFLYGAGTFIANALRRGMGGDMYNETLTAARLDAEPSLEAMRIIHRWIHEYGLLPSDADMASFAAEQHGDAHVAMPLFVRGHFALLLWGRSAVTYFRPLGLDTRLSVIEPPNAGFPNTSMGVRIVTIYENARNREMAEYFLEYLTSEDYNVIIAEEGEDMPPNPAFARTDAFLHPPDYPNEWGAHETFARAAEEIAIGEPFSPYILPGIAHRMWARGYSEIMSGRRSIEEAMQIATQRIAAEIAASISHPDNEALLSHYRRAVEDQRRIDERLAAGEPIPLSLIRNPYYRRYYLSTGQAYRDESAL